MLFKNALITGGAGFIGSHLSRALLENGLNVTIIDNLSTGKKGNIPTGAEFIEGDILDLDLLVKTMLEYDIEIVFHEAARVAIRDSLKNFIADAQANIIGTANVLSACSKSKIKKLVYASSMAVYADSLKPEPIREDYKLEPISPYGISKLACEKYCMTLTKQMDISCSILRYFNTYGIGQQYTPYVGVITIFINRLKEGKDIEVFGDGNQSRDFVHVSDIVNANLLAMASNNSYGIFNIGTSNATTVNDLARLIRDKINPDAKIIHKPKQPGELVNSIADITCAKERLGFEPKRVFAENIDNIIEFDKLK